MTMYLFLFAYMFFFPLSPTRLPSDLTIYIWVTQWFSYKKEELHTLREHQGSIPVSGRVRVAHHLVFCVMFCFCYYLSSFCVVCAQYWLFLWIFHSWSFLRGFSNVFLCHYGSSSHIKGMVVYWCLHYLVTCSQ